MPSQFHNIYHHPPPPVYQAQCAMPGLSPYSPPYPASPYIAPVAPTPASYDTGEDYVSLFVSDLPLQADMADIARVFQFPMDHLPPDAQGTMWIQPFNVTDVRVMPGDGGTSKYAFVRFDSVEERTRAMFAMQGLLCLGNPIRLSRAHSKERTRAHQSPGLLSGNRSKDERQRDNVAIDAFNAHCAAIDPKNSKVFVGNISPKVLFPEMLKHFSQIGRITNVNTGKCCAFISYSRKADAATAIATLDGMLLDNRPLRITWSRSSVQPLLQVSRNFTPAAPATPIAGPLRRHHVHHGHYDNYHQRSGSTSSVSTASTNTSMPTALYTPTVYSPTNSGFLNVHAPAFDSFSGFRLHSRSDPLDQYRLGASHKASFPPLYTLSEEADDFGFTKLSLSDDEESNRDDIPAETAPNMGRRKTIASIDGMGGISRYRTGLDLEGERTRLLPMGRAQSSGGASRGHNTMWSLNASGSGETLRPLSASMYLRRESLDSASNADAAAAAVKSIKMGRRVSLPATSLS